MYKQYVSVEQALQMIIGQAALTEVEMIPLGESLGRVLAKPIIATSSIPSFNKSPFDGYAVRFDDIKHATVENPIVLQVIEEIPAGYAPQKQVCAGEAARIMTGAPLPAGADTIIKFEDTHLQQNDDRHYQKDGEQVQILVSPRKAGNYSKIGEDMNSGDVLLQEGRVIDSAVIAVLATFGIQQVPVHFKPTAIVFASGDELVDVSEDPPYGKIRNSNSPSIAAQLQSWGSLAVDGGIIKDNRQQIAKTLLNALQEYQVVITTGGVSVGDYDIIKDVLQDIGAEILFWRVSMRPGTPMVVAKYGDRMIFGLSGNPSAAYISCELFVRAYILKVQGFQTVWRSPVKAILTEDIGKPANQMRFVRAVAEVATDGNVYVTPLAKQKSGILGNLLESNALLHIYPAQEQINQGDVVDAMLLAPPLRSVEHD